MPPDESEGTPAVITDPPAEGATDEFELMTNIRIGSGLPYQRGVLGAGERLYLDARSTFTHVPPALGGLEFIRTADQEQNESGPGAIRFILTEEAVVYILYDLYDTRGENSPAWLQDEGWDLLPNLVLTDDAPRRIYQKTFPAGEVVLGDDSQRPDSGFISNYAVAAGVSEPASPPTSEAGDSAGPAMTVNHVILDAQILDQYLTDGRFAGYVRPGDSFILVSGKDSGEIDSGLLSSWAGMLKEEYPDSAILAATSGTDNVRYGAPRLDPTLFAGLMADYEPGQENAPGFSWDITETVSIWEETAGEIQDWGLKAWGKPSGRSLPGFDRYGAWDYGILASIMGGLNVQTQDSCSYGNFDSALQHLAAQYRGAGATADLFVEVSVDEGQSDSVSPEGAMHCAQLAWEFAEVDGVTLWWSYPSASLAEEFLILREGLLGAEILNPRNGDEPTPDPSLTPEPTVAPPPVADTPPDEETLEGPGGVAFYDSSPFTYVTNPRNDTVQVFNTGGALVNEWGGQGSGVGQFDNPGGIAINHGNGLVYIADTGNHRVQIFDTAGGFVTQWGEEGDGEGQFNSPGGIAINPDSGFVYVADTGNNRVQVFNANGGFVTQWGSSGGGNGKFRGPTGIAFNPLDGKVYVADTGNNRVQVFLSVGAYDFKWGRRGSGEGQFLSPGGILVHPVSGSLYVADSGNHRVQAFDRLGQLLFEWGSEGDGRSQFRNPVGLSADPESGRVYVADSGNQRIQVFSQGGTFAFGWIP